MRIKPGYKTSEFWFTLVSFIFSGLYLVGLINDNNQKEDLIRDISHGVESAILIGGQLAILWKYINSRKEIKQTTNIVTEDKPQQDDNINRSKSNEPKRTTKTKSRKSNTRKPKSSK